MCLWSVSRWNSTVRISLALAHSFFKCSSRVAETHDVTHHKTPTVNMAKDTIINDSIYVPRHSMKGVLLFCEPHVRGALRESFFNPDN